jgi:hypothetical protein
MTGISLPLPQANRETQDGHGRVTPQARLWSVLSRKLAGARYEITTRDREAAFVRAPSPSTVIH